MRLRMKGIIPILIILSLVVVIASAMFYKVKYEDHKDQKAWEEVLEADREVADRAREALPLVNEYERATAGTVVAAAHADELATRILNLFPEFRAPGAGTRPALIPVERIRMILESYIRRG